MPAQRTRSIALTPALDDFVDDLLHSGRYQNASEIVRAGLRALQRDEAELAEIQERLGRSMDQANRGEYAEGTANDVIGRVFGEEIDAQEGQ